MVNSFGDMRTRDARRLVQLYNDYINSCGNPVVLSEMQHQVARRAAFLTLEIEKLEERQKQHADVDMELYAKLVALLQRLVSKLTAKELQIPPSPKDPVEAMEDFFRAGSKPRKRRKPRTRKIATRPVTKQAAPRVPLERVQLIR